MQAQNAISENGYDKMLIEFEQNYLCSINYEEALVHHRKPVEYMYGVLRNINTLILEMHNRPELMHHDSKEFNYVPTKITQIWESDDRIVSEYEAILLYCKQTEKDPDTILTHMAEFRAMQGLYSKVNTDTLKQTSSSQLKPMPKNFEIERREVGGKQFLKVFLRGDADYESIATILGSLNSIRRANITQQGGGKLDLTIHPAKTYEITEVEQEIELALTNYFESNLVDPQFASETLSAISDKAYFQILDYIILLGKNLENFQELNTKFDEERYRDYFIPFLNSVSLQHSAKGEVFNKKGKTDILVFDNSGNNIFIAECKLWKGEANLLKAVNQLLENYTNWRDEKTALVIFNRDNKKFSEVIEKATKALENHELCKKSLGKRTETSYSYIFRHPDDENQTIKLELIILNFV